MLRLEGPVRPSWKLAGMCRLDGVAVFYASFARGTLWRHVRGRFGRLLFANSLARWEFYICIFGRGRETGNMSSRPSSVPCFSVGVNEARGKGACVRVVYVFRESGS